LWILASSPKIKKDLKKELTTKAAEFGFATNKLIYVDHR
jgi:lipocalin